MNLSEPFIARPVMTTLVMITIVLIGIWGYFQLPVSNMPSVEYPNINVVVGFPGASPETMANNVATPLEKEFLTISGLVSATSSNTLGQTSILLQFDITRNIDAAATDVNAAIARAIPNLPPELPSAPTYRKVNPALTPIIILALTSETLTRGQLYDYANTYIGQPLSLINGVAQVLVYGSPTAVRIQVDPNKIAPLGITLQDVAKAVSDGNPYLPTGILDNPAQSSTIIVNGQLQKASAYQSLIVRYIDNAPLRIQDIAQAVDSTSNYRYSLKYMEKDLELPSVALAILPQPGSNAVQISKDMYKILPTIQAQLPPSVDIRMVNDKSVPIRQSIRDVEYTLLIAFVLVVFIIFIYLGNARDTIIPSLVLPISVIGTFAIMKFLGFSLDNLSLMALILAIGFIIDDAIVVIENIVRHVEEGKSPWRAALDGSKQISFTIISMTLSLVAVFIPLLFMSGILGKILAEFALTLTTITLLSGFISLTLTPMLCSIFIPPHDKAKEPRGLFAIGQRINQKMLEGYKPALKWILGHRLFALAMLLLSLFLSVWFLVTLPRDFIPHDDIGFFIIYTQGAEGISYEKMIALQTEVEEIVRKDPNIDEFVSIAASQLFRYGTLYVHLKPIDQRVPVLDVINGLQKQTSQLVGINTFYKNVPLIDLSLGSQVKGAYQFAMQSFNSKHLYPAAADVIAQMHRIPGIEGVNSDLEISNPQMSIDILRDQASSFGLTANDIERTLDIGYSGNRISRIQSPLTQYDVIVELAPKYQQDPSIFNIIYLRSPTTGQLVPMSAATKWIQNIGPTSINHINQFPAVTVSFNVDREASLSEVLDELHNVAHETLPRDVTSKVIGAAQTFEISIQSSAVLLIVTILAIYIILGILYESYIHPITILTTLPPAALGGFLTLYLFDMSLSMYSFLGIIVLIGIVKKNGIMMVDFAIENERIKGESPEQSIYEASIVRFRPIMMTTMAAIVGALPIALGFGMGAEARRPLGLVIIGGLLLSQLVTLFITPVIYLYMDKFTKRA